MSVEFSNYDFISETDPDLALPEILKLLLGQTAYWDQRHLILVVVDGLGWWNLQEYLGYAPNLRKLIRSNQGKNQGHAAGQHQKNSAEFANCTARSVCPSTTAAAITSLLCGVAPGRHNMLSYELYDPEVSAKFNLINFSGYPKKIEEFQSHQTWFERLRDNGQVSFALGPKRFIGQGLSLAALRGAQYVASDNLEKRARDAAAYCSTGVLTYFYIAEVDHAGHSYGVGSDKWLEALELADRAIGIMLDALPAQAEVAVTADHGMINTDSERSFDLANCSAAETITEVTGEGRAIHLYTKGEPERLCEILSAELPGEVSGGTQWLVSNPEQKNRKATLVLKRDEAAELMKKYNGVTVMRPELLGDVVVYSAGKSQVLDSRFHKPQVFQMIGLHGGLSEQEMRVPLLRY